MLKHCFRFQIQILFDEENEHGLSLRNQFSHPTNIIDRVR